MKLPSLRTALFLAWLPLLPGCTDPLSPGDELRDARRRWEARRIETYAYRISRYCECVPEFTRTADVMVVRGVVTRARYVNDGTEVPAERMSMYPTVEELFEGVERALARNPAR